MAWSYLTNASSYNGKVFGWKEIICDEEADIAKLPTRKDAIAIGSIAHVLDGSKTYVLSNGRVWTRTNFNGDGLSDLPEATEADVHKILGINENGKYALIDAEYGYRFKPVHAESKTGESVAFRTPIIDLVKDKEYTFVFTISGTDGDFILTSTAENIEGDNLIWSAQSGKYTFKVVYNVAGTGGLATEAISVIVTETETPIDVGWTFDYEPDEVHKIPAEYLDVEGGGNSNLFIIPCTISGNSEEGYTLTLADEVGYDGISAAFEDGKVFAVQVTFSETDRQMRAFATVCNDFVLFSDSEVFSIKALLDETNVADESVRWYVSITARTNAITAVVQPECSFNLWQEFGSNTIKVITELDHTIDGEGMLKLFNDGANIVMTADHQIAQTLGLYENMKILSAYVDDGREPQIYYFVTQAFYTGTAFAICRINYDVRSATWSYDIIGG